MSGEPGIGKSRLVAALQELVQNEPHIRLPNFSSPYHSNSALHPIIARLEGTAGFGREDTADAKFEKLKALLAQDMFLAGTIVLLLGVMTVIGTLISDILLVWIDPRIRLEE